MHDAFRLIDASSTGRRTADIPLVGLAFLGQAFKTLKSSALTGMLYQKLWLQQPETTFVLARNPSILSSWGAIMDVRVLLGAFGVALYTASCFTNIEKSKHTP